MCALKFTKVAAKSAPHKNAPSADTPKAPTPSYQPQQAKAAFSGFLKTGAAAQEAFKAEEAKQELARASYGKLFRFFMKDDEERRITFLDGELTEDGILDVGTYYEHSLMLNGTLEHFVCTADVDETQPCPLCEAGHKRSLVGVMTVLDHTPYTIQSGPNKGQVRQNTKRLYVAKNTTLEILRKIAVKREGLAGCTFDVSRIGDKSPAVGNQFDFVEKFDSYEAIAEKFGLTVEDIQPAEYTKEIVYRTPEQLIEIGIGTAIKSNFGGGSFNKQKLADKL